MRKLSAHYILTGTGEVLKKGIITLNDQDIVTDLTDTGGDLAESASVEFYNGILVPGFVNSHCHLEFSYLRDSFPEKMKMAEFLKQIFLHRSAQEQTMIAAAKNADREMWQNGIAAVGDVSNHDLSFEVKSTSRIYYHTFIESLGFSPESAEMAFEWSKEMLAKTKSTGLTASIVPHAPYSISKKLFEKISQWAREENSILSMHSQESTLEDELYQTGSGPIIKHLKENLLLDLSFFVPYGKSALSTVLDWLPAENHLLLVHNTCTKEEDIQTISSIRQLDKTWFVLCPNSNLFIEDHLPDINLFWKHKLNVCLGTDSLSSNHQLSILEEMKTISDHFSQIPLPQLISWATKNGADALKISSWAGSIEKGKKPGINLIEGADLQKLRLNSQSKVKRLV